LQVDVNGVRKATRSGQRYFPLYILAPYRLLCAITGLFIALFWTLFPAQISEHSILRNKVSRSLSVLARYSYSVSTTLNYRIHGREGNPNSTSSPGSKLKSARYKILYEELALLSEMRQHSEMTRYEVSIGGKFPKQVYDAVIDEIQR
jgi:hypothetical protein